MLSSESDRYCMVHKTLSMEKCICPMIGCFVEKHRCVCGYDYTCMADKHDCRCEAAESECYASNHRCVCDGEYESCKSVLHDDINLCTYHKYPDDPNQHDACISKVHHTCICPNEACDSVLHKCICAGYKAWWTCKYVGEFHKCSCKRVVQGALAGHQCLSKWHDCVCSSYDDCPDWIRGCKAARHFCTCDCYFPCQSISPNHDCICPDDDCIARSNDHRCICCKVIKYKMKGVSIVCMSTQHKCECERLINAKIRGVSMACMAARHYCECERVIEAKIQGVSIECLANEHSTCTCRRFTSCGDATCHHDTTCRVALARKMCQCKTYHHCVCDIVGVKCISNSHPYKSQANLATPYAAPYARLYGF